MLRSLPALAFLLFCALAFFALDDRAQFSFSTPADLREIHRSVEQMLTATQQASEARR